ncbi:MAG TPA: Calx-beta domain-containing protein, partial [Roseiflexaceae bacterium]|nr:Calx-beta domain-containing protein [Roseiflexaceae bacterium]
TQQLGSLAYATSGKNNFWGYDQGSGDPGDYAIAMIHDVAVPANAFFHFRHAYDFETDGSTAFDGGVVEYSTDGGSSWQDAGPLFDEHGYDGTLSPASDPPNSADNPLHDRDAFVGLSYGYTSSRADLSSLAGKQVRFRFRIGTDGYGAAYGWFIDDIRVYTCSNTPPAPLPRVTFSSTGMQVDEDAGQALLPVTLSSASAVTVTVNYSVTGGTGVAGKDYALASNALVFPPNVTTGIIPVGIIHNTDSSADRTLVLSLSNPRQSTLGTNTSITLTIANKDVFDPDSAAIRTFLPLLSR